MDLTEDYYLIRKHPYGGFGVLLQNPYLPLSAIQEEDDSFDSIDNAADHVLNNSHRYAVRVHSECIDEPLTDEQALAQATKVIGDANAELLRLYGIVSDIRTYAIHLVNALHDEEGQSVGNVIGEKLLDIIKD
jgi:hypothetical protein